MRRMGGLQGIMGLLPGVAKVKKQLDDANIDDKMIKQLGIRAEVFIPSRGCWLCNDCEYDPDCREWTGNEEGGGRGQEGRALP